MTFWKSSVAQMMTGEQVMFFWEGDILVGPIKRFTPLKGVVPAHYVIRVNGRDYGVAQQIVEDQLSNEDT